MKKKHLFFAALFFAALAFGFVGCENPDSESGISIEKPGDDSTSDKPSTPEKPTLIATGDVTDLAENSATFWGRLNADTLWAFPNVKWGVEYAYDREAVSQHKHQETTKVNCTAGLQGANMDEFSVTIDGLQRSQTIYYSAYILINDMKYVYGELDSVHIVKLTLKPNNSDYGTVTGSGYYDVGAEVTITATSKENYYFTGWNDCDSKELIRTVQVKSDTTITANFAKKPYLTANSSIYGTVTGSGYYEPNTEVTITAIPNYDYIEFVQWSDGNTENPRTITVTSDVTYTATFKVNYVSNFTPAAFSVSADKQVYFSPGNLQYIQSSDTWQFASCQWECVGTDNVTGGEVEYDATYGYSREGTALADKVDLFGWSTSTTNFGVRISGLNSSYSGSFVDWGTNQIGDDVPNTWRTLTYGEWNYLRNSRPNASSLRGVAQVSGVNGLVFLPDSWTCPEGITFKPGFHDDYGADYYVAYQTFTADQWSKMEAAGAVFLPAAGTRYGSDVSGVQLADCYWSATEDDSCCAYYLVFGSNGANMSSIGRSEGFSVRLFKDL